MLRTCWTCCLNPNLSQSLVCTLWEVVLEEETSLSLLPSQVCLTGTWLEFVWRLKDCHGWGPSHSTSSSRLSCLGTPYTSAETRRRLASCFLVSIFLKIKMSSIKQKETIMSTTWHISLSEYLNTSHFTCGGERLDLIRNYEAFW